MFVMMREIAGMSGKIKGGESECRRHNNRCHRPVLIGRSSIPETAVGEPRSRGVLDAPFKPGHDTEH